MKNIVSQALPHCVLAMMMVALSLAGVAQAGDYRFVPDFTVKSDDYTVLMAADARNPHNLHAFINDHRRLQVKDWPVGDEASWEVEVLEAGEYAVNVLFCHSPNIPLTVMVSAAASHCQTVSQYHDTMVWRRLPLEGTLTLARGKQTVRLDITAVNGPSKETIELLSVEVVPVQVKERLHRAAIQMRAQTNSQWFRDAGYGVMCHWTSQIVPRSGPAKPYSQAVADFNVNGFADQIALSGAKFVTITTSHAMMYFPAPLAVLDHILPGRTSTRDLVADIADALDKRGIRLMLYYHLGSDGDQEWLKACGFSKTDTREFWNNWTAVIGDIGKRYGTKLAGWWFDDGTANYYYRSAPWQALATAAKAGNPDRLICFNPWILPTPTEFEDYYAGEGNEDPTVQGWLRPGDHGRISGGTYAGLQGSAALVMEDDWLHTRLDTQTPPPRYSSDQIAALLRASLALHSVPMFNMQIYQDGTFSPATVEVLHQAHEAIQRNPSQ